MRFGLAEYELDEERFELRRAGKKVPVEPKVLRILLHLVKHRHRVVSKHELLATAWAGVTVSEASLWRAIMLARKAIGDDLQRDLVTVRGAGFRVAARVEERAGAGVDAAEPETDPTLVGRDAGVAALEERLGCAVAGRGNVVWITGEAGIGKTRLAEDLARRARLGGARVVLARADDPAGASPFGLWASVVRDLAAEGTDPDAALLAAARPVLEGEAVTGPARAALFDALARLLAEASRRTATVLILDDLHRADRDSLDLLRYVVREIRRAALLVVGAFRDTAAFGDGRAPLLGELLREYASDVIPLRGLGEADVARYVEESAGVAPPPALARDLVQRTGGNPLYLRQVLKTDWAERALNERAVALATSMDLEQPMLEAVHLHLEGLSAESRRLLTVAAVLGPEVDTARLAAVSRLDREPLLDGLDEAHRARLLVQEPSGKRRFSHALVRDVLYKRLGGAERAQMHHEAAERLAAHFGDAAPQHAAELARHATRALPLGDASRAVALSLEAANQAAARGAWGRALKSYGLASQALGHVRGERARRLEVQMGTARAHAGAGDAAAAREAYLDAVTLARAFGDPAALAEAALGFARLPAARGDPLRETLLAEALLALRASHGEDAARLRAALEAGRR